MTCQTRICIGSGAEQDKARHSPYLDRPLRSREQAEAKIADYAKRVTELQALWNRTRGPHLGIDLADQSEACRPDMAMPEPDPELRPFWQRLRRLWRRT